MSEMQNVQDMFNDYGKNGQEKKPNNGKKIENILSKMFQPRNEKEYFRMTPPNKGEKIIEKAFFHQVQTNSTTGKKWRKIYCLEKNGDKVPKLDANGNPEVDQQGNKVMVTPRCPHCEKNRRILDTQDKTVIGIKKDTMTPDQLKIFEKNKEIFMSARKYEANLYYIIAGIDRLAERDGKKFWRFKHNFKNEGVLNKLMPVLSDFVEMNKVDFTSPKNGADLSITVTDAYMPNGKSYKAVSAITMGNSKPLHNDENVANQWLNDKISWRDIFKPASAPGITPEKYMELILEEKDPYWDDSNPQNKHWVFPGNPELEENAKQVIAANRNNNTNNKEDAKIDDLDSKIGNLNSDSSGTYQDNHVDLTNSVETNNNTKVQNTQSTTQQSTTDEPKQVEKPVETVQESITNTVDEEDDDLSDLPF
jgi:glutaredoxin